MQLNEIYPAWLIRTQTGIQGGFFSQLFTYLQTINAIPAWLPDTDIAYSLDIEYHGNRSGQKEISPLLRNMLIDNKLTSNLSQHVCAMFWAMQGLNLARIWENLTIEYNPIENYSMTEQSTDENSGTTSTTTGGTETGSGSGTTAGKLYGFDSATAVNRDETTTSNSETTTRTGTESGEHETTNTHTLTRSGNIGVTTSAGMIRENLELFGNNNFYINYLFPMVDMILTIPIY